jgi:hypothetical protein
MSRRVSEHPDDVTVYLVVNDFGEFGRAFVETDIAEADRETVIRNFVSGWVRRKKSPSMAGAFGARTRGGDGGMMVRTHCPRLPTSPKSSGEHFHEF